MLTFAHFGTILLLNISWIYICNNPPPPPPLDISENSSLLVYPTGMAFLGSKFVSRELKLKLQSSGNFAKMPSPSENIAYDGFFSTVLLAVPGCTWLYLAVPGCNLICVGLPLSTDRHTLHLADFQTANHQTFHPSKTRNDKIPWTFSHTVPIVYKAKDHWVLRFAFAKSLVCLTRGMSKSYSSDLKLLKLGCDQVCQETQFS